MVPLPGVTINTLYSMSIAVIFLTTIMEPSSLRGSYMKVRFGINVYGSQSTPFSTVPGQSDGPPTSPAEPQLAGHFRRAGI